MPVRSQSDCHLPSDKQQTGCCNMAVVVIPSLRVEQCFLSDHSFGENLEKIDDLSNCSWVFVRDVTLSLPPTEGCHNRICELVLWGKVNWKTGLWQRRSQCMQKTKWFEPEPSFVVDLLICLLNL